MIFISYSWGDKKVVPVIERTLYAYGQSYWIDYVNLDLGSCLTTQIQKAIDKCSEVILVNSQNSIRSPWVQYELEMARKMGKHVLRVDAYTLEKKTNKAMLPTIYKLSVLRSRCRSTLPRNGQLINFG